MREYPAQSWSSVVAAFQSFAAANPHLMPMAEFVRELANSHFAAGLYPQASMHSLRLSQHPFVSLDAERASVDWENGDFVVRYQGAPTAPVWTKRSPDGMVAIRRLFEHLRWFIEPAAPIAQPPSNER